MVSKSVALLLLLGALLSCQPDPSSPKGFSLPKGDVNNGKQVFLQYRCLACHTLEGIEDETVTKELDNAVLLGGQVSHVKTYADLLTSIINPSHKLARGYRLEDISAENKSVMHSYNDIMTVSELVDLVAFLQVQYEIKPEQYTHYNVYHIP